MLRLSIVYAVPIIVFIAVSSHGYPRVGYTFDPCRSDEHCLGTRVCNGTNENDEFVSCKNSSVLCLCVGKFRRCKSSGDCETGERCFDAELSTGPRSVCLSCRVQEVGTFTFSEKNPSSCDGVWLGRYTEDICWGQTLDCATGRICGELQLDGSVEMCSYETEMCLCLPRKGPKTCTLSSSCDSGERCAIGGEFKSRTCISCSRVEEDEDINSVDSTYSCETSPPEQPPSSEPVSSPTSAQSTTSSPTPSNTISQPQKYSPGPLVSAIPPAPQSSICIASKHLMLYGPSHLVYPVHLPGLVLCDEFESCATPGHVVVYNRSPMTMSSYCSRHSACSQKKALVNSPRMSAGLRISSYTPGLQFTALSARFGSSLEQYVMRLLVFAGL